MCDCSEVDGTWKMQTELQLLYCAMNDDHSRFLLSLVFCWEYYYRMFIYKLFDVISSRLLKYFEIQHFTNRN